MGKSPQVKQNRFFLPPPLPLVYCQTIFCDWEREEKKFGNATGAAKDGGNLGGKVQFEALRAGSAASGKYLLLYVYVVPMWA